MIAELTHKICAVADSINLTQGNADQLLFDSILKATEMHKDSDDMERIESKGVHFIDSGEVLVVGKSNVPNTRL